MTTAPKRLPCPVCQGQGEEVFFSLPHAPLLCHVRYTDPEKAKLAPAGRIDLTCCEQCGMIYNRSFEPSKVSYEVAYDNALHCSSHFRSYAAELAETLCDRYGLSGKTVVEVGSGDGFFLNLLCERGCNRGWGFDPTEYQRLATSADVHWVQGYFSADSMPSPPNLICCRHVLEHLPTPGTLLQEIRRACSEETVVFFEVPDGRFTFEHGGWWDILYEHCSYYTPQSLRRVFEAAGFRILRLESAYHGQFLQIEAMIDSGRTTANAGGSGDDMIRTLREFSREFRAAQQAWENQLEVWFEQQRRVALWGAGTKGVMFLNAVNSNGVSYVVDINPDKEGMFIPRTELPIVSPASLTAHPPDAVVVMNPAYADEIRTSLAGMRIHTEVLTA